MVRRNSSAGDTTRAPCPDRILDDFGGAFAMGAIGGSALHFLKGIKNSPRGERVFGGLQAVRMNAPRIGGAWGVWGGPFSTFDCSMVYLRQKEDPWNSIFAGAATGGILSMRQGLRASARSALVGAVLLALIEGVGITITRNLQSLEERMMQERMMQEGYPDPMGQLPTSVPTISQEEGLSSSSSSSTSWFGGLFGGKKQDTPGSGSNSEVILESFDTPMPSFEYK